MARLLFVVALALLAAAVSAEPIYTEDQLTDLSDRVYQCVAPVPDPSEYDRPGSTCHFVGVEALYNGFVKEAVTDEVTTCLSELEVVDDMVSSVKVCLVAAMAKDVVSA